MNICGAEMAAPAPSTLRRSLRQLARRWFCGRTIPCFKRPGGRRLLFEPKELEIWEGGCDLHGGTRRRVVRPREGR